MTTNALHRQARRRHFSTWSWILVLSCFDPGSTVRCGSRTVVWIRDTGPRSVGSRGGLGDTGQSGDRSDQEECGVYAATYQATVAPASLTTRQTSISSCERPRRCAARRGSCLPPRRICRASPSASTYRPSS
eukprot:1722886-Prymnesium_polylepis.1